MRRDVDSDNSSYFEKAHRGAIGSGSKLNLVFLFYEVLGTADGKRHTIDGQKGSKIGRVRGDKNERKEPPGCTGYSR
jgi:hypothetical protein